MNPTPETINKYKFSIIRFFPFALLAIAMFWASSWQWTRYLEKKALVKTYADHNISIPLTLKEVRATSPSDYLYKKLKLAGKYDFNNQVIIENRKTAEGPGYAILTPLIIDDTLPAIMVSRGFIPYKSRSSKEWLDYNEKEGQIEIVGAIQSSVKKRSAFSPENDKKKLLESKRVLYADLQFISAAIPYPIETDFFVERIGLPQNDKAFPKELVQIQVPPSTHFGYTIEWILLGCATLIIGYAYQRFPKFFSRKSYK